MQNKELSKLNNKEKKFKNEQKIYTLHTHTQNTDSQLANMNFKDTQHHLSVGNAN